MKSLITLVCAWVLWTEMIPGVQRWSPIEAMATKAECELFRNRFLTGMETTGFHRIGSSRLPLKSDDNLYLLQALCLPDTVDPRDPKR